MPRRRDSANRPHAVGSHPLDESVFGIRDLTGSVVNRLKRVAAERDREVLAKQEEARAVLEAEAASADEQSSVA